MTTARENTPRRKPATSASDSTADEAPAPPAPPADGARQCLISLTNDFRLFCDSHQAAEQLELIGRMQQGIKAVRDSFSAAGLPPWAQFAGSLSTLLFAMATKPGFPTFSTFRTTADALALLHEVVNSGVRWNGASETALDVLVAAQDAALRQSLVPGLQRQGLRVTECADAAAALDRLSQSPFDLVFYDTKMPEMDEFSFTLKCRKLRAHERTPIILVTPLSDFERRCSSLLSDTCDFIAQPVVPSEATVKAFVFGLKHLIESRRPERAGAQPAPAARAESATPPAAPTASLPSPGESLGAPVKEIERNLDHERAAADWAQTRARLERELEERSSRLEQAQRRATELDSSVKSLNLDLAQAGRRESALKKEGASLDLQIERLNRTLEEIRQELARENERRLAADRLAEQLNHRLRESSQADGALRRQLEQSAQEHAEALASLQTALRQETAARHEAEQAAERQTADLARIEKLLGQSRLQVQQAREGASALQQARRRVQTELRDILERQAQLDDQAGGLDQHLAALGQALKSGAAQ